jgi:CRP-like cAMP-binding protein
MNLPTHSFFATMTEQQVAALQPGAQRFEAQPNTLLIREGSPADSFYLIEAGRIAIELPLPGRAPNRLQVVGPNESVGWSWLIPPYQWEFDARVIDPTSGVRFDAAWLRGQCDSDPALGVAVLKKVLRMVAFRLTATRLQLVDLYK